jgi:hypothetical protein
MAGFRGGGLAIVLAASACGTTSSDPCSSPADGASVTVESVASGGVPVQPIRFTARSQSAILATNLSFVDLSDQADACVSLDPQGFYPHTGRTVLQLQWPGTPQTTSMAPKGFLGQLFIDSPTAPIVANPSSGAVTVEAWNAPSGTSAGRVTGSYNFQFPGGVVVSGSFDAPACPGYTCGP